MSPKYVADFVRSHREMKVTRLITKRLMSMGVYEYIPRTIGTELPVQYLERRCGKLIQTQLINTYRYSH